MQVAIEENEAQEIVCGPRMNPVINSLMPVKKMEG